MSKPARPITPILERLDTPGFWQHVDKREGDACWEWTGTRSRPKPTAQSGYGIYAFEGANYRAHRISYAIANGGVDEDLVVDHLCRNPCCVNPNHLEAVSNTENVLRGESPQAKNREKTECDRGHPLTLDNIYAYQGKRICRTCRAITTIHYNRLRRGKIPAGTKPDWKALEEEYNATR